ncbi:MAG: methionine biosynthesis protein MetW [Gammaproteobacteria bacterium]|nr:methionine biosynthesis protein MetW [Gammaproteobacteria bacterium]
MNLRADLALISDWIKPGARILDLGCGDGTLLKHLRDTMNVSGYGIEIEQSNIVKCIESGINVIHNDLDEGINNFFDADSFDYVVMTQALQAIRHPEQLLDEVLRVSSDAIITFPNMGYWTNRVQLALGGHMPVTKSLPNYWYNTPNIHLCTLYDFENLCKQLDIRIIKRHVVDSQHKHNWLAKLFPNLFGEIAIYHITKK